MSKQNANEPSRPWVAVTLHQSPGFIPQLRCGYRDREAVLAELKALFNDDKSYDKRLIGLSLTLAVLARDPSTSLAELDYTAGLLIDMICCEDGQGALRQGVHVYGLKDVSKGRAPEAKPPKHRRLPKPPKGKRRKWHPDYVDAVPKIVEAARSANWAGLTTN